MTRRGLSLGPFAMVFLVVWVGPAAAEPLSLSGGISYHLSDPAGEPLW
jgi:hypothetical protein